MSRGKSSKRRRGHLLRILESVGILSPEAVREVEEEQEHRPLEETANIIMEKGLASARDIETAEELPSEDLPVPPNGAMQCDPTTGEILADNFEQTHKVMNDAVTQSVHLGDIADAIAKKGKG